MIKNANSAQTIEVLVKVSADNKRRIAGTATAVISPEETDISAAIEKRFYEETTLIAAEMDAIHSVLSKISSDPQTTVCVYLCATSTVNSLIALQAQLTEHRNPTRSNGEKAANSERLLRLCQQGDRLGVTWSHLSKGHRVGVVEMLKEAAKSMNNVNLGEMSSPASPVGGV